MPAPVIIEVPVPLPMSVLNPPVVILAPALDALYVFARHVVHGASPVALQVPGPHLQPVRILVPATLNGELAGQGMH